jgi:uncharacterized protein
MPNNLFIDTSGWANFFIQTEPHHTQALKTLATSRKHNQTFVTTNYILTELIALLDSPLRQPRNRVFEIINNIKTRPYIQILYINEALDRAAWELCQNRPDKSWSLVDCSSFVIMQQLNIPQALTTDHHFEQAGFTRLLKPK